MPKFRQKPATIDAFQMNRVDRNGVLDWPDWLREAWNRPRHLPGALMPHLDGGDTLFLKTVAGATPIEWGDWIVRDADGRLTICDPETFARVFEPAEG